MTIDINYNTNGSCREKRLKPALPGEQHLLHLLLCPPHGTALACCISASHGGCFLLQPLSLHVFLCRFCDSVKLSSYNAAWAEMFPGRNYTSSWWGWEARTAQLSTSQGCSWRRGVEMARYGGVMGEFE